MSPAATAIVVAPLRRHPQLCAFFTTSLRSEWPSWYGPGGSGDAEVDLMAFANAEGKLPVGVVAFTTAGVPIGLAALKATSIPSHRHLGPWAAAGYVVPTWRRRGIGAALLNALLREASRLGHVSVYCATATAGSLLAREGWRLIDSVPHEGQRVEVFRRDLAGNPASPNMERAERARTDNAR